MNCLNEFCDGKLDFFKINLKHVKNIEILESKFQILVKKYEFF